MTQFYECKCIDCGVTFGLHPETERTLRQSGATFKCPFGHGMVFRAGESETDKLRRERDRLKQRTAQLEDEARKAWAHAQDRENERQAAERRASAARGQVTRLKNRAAAGVCPCCNRSFANLRQHMTNQHPTFATAEAPEGATLQ